MDCCAISVTVDTVELVSIAALDGGAIVLDSAKIKSESGEDHGTCGVLVSGKERHEYSEGPRDVSKGKICIETVGSLGDDVDSKVSRITDTIDS